MIKLDDLIYEEIPKVRKNFYASDFNKADLDLYFSWIGEPKSNPPVWHDTLRWGAGIGVEDKMLDILKMNKVVPLEYDQKVHGGFKIEREGITISGYTDARTSLEAPAIPIEIKSINNKNSQDVRNYENGYPKENYVGQLSIYMDALGVDIGYLFASTIDGLHRFLFECKKISPGIYRCGNVTVNVTAEYQRWARLIKNNVEPRVLPDVFQYRYKHDVASLDFHKVPVSKISLMRNDRGVYGDWQIQYSDYKNKIIALQGTVPGYTNEELAIIREKTEGYTTWGKPKKEPKVKKEPVEKVKKPSKKAVTVV